MPQACAADGEKDSLFLTSHSCVTFKRGETYIFNCVVIKEILERITADSSATSENGKVNDCHR